MGSSFSRFCHHHKFWKIQALEPTNQTNKKYSLLVFRIMGGAIEQRLRLYTNNISQWVAIFICYAPPLHEWNNSLRLSMYGDTRNELSNALSSCSTPGSPFFSSDFFDDWRILNLYPLIWDTLQISVVILNCEIHLSFP